VLAATHQVNRVAALAASAAELLAFGKAYMAQIVRNAQTLGAALDRRGIPVLGAHKGYTTTQVIADVCQFGGGLHVAQQLAKANIITNKNLIPADRPEDWDHPVGCAWAPSRSRAWVWARPRWRLLPTSSPAS
jgi:glycine hydroxymethyltransferase